MPNNEINMDVQGQGSASVSMNPSVDDAAFVGRAEAWAVGKRNGTDVPSTDPAYHNNAKYYATEAAASAEDAHQYTAAAVHTWLENNVDPETGYVLDRTLSEKLAAAPADMVGDLKSALNKINNKFPIEQTVIDIQDYSSETVIISPSTGKWAVASGYRSCFIPITDEYEITVTANQDDYAVVALLKTNEYTSGTYPDYATGSGRTVIQPGESETLIVPADANYLFVLKKGSGTTDYTPTSIIFKARADVPVVDDTLTVSGDAADAKTVGDIFDNIENDIPHEVELIDKSGLSSGKYINTSIDNNWTNDFVTNSGSLYTQSAIDVSGYMGDSIIVEIGASDSHTGVRELGFCNSSNIVSSCFSEGSLTFESENSKLRARIPITDTHFFFSCSSKTSLTIYIDAKGKILRLATTDILYVATTGSDSNDGSNLYPFATVNKALESGAKRVCIKGGTYSQTIDLSLTKYGEIDIVNSTPTEKVVFIAPNSLITDSETAVSGYTKVYSAPCSKSFSTGNDWIFQDGVPDASTIITADKRMPEHRGQAYRCYDTKIVRTTATILADALAEIEADDGYKWFISDGTIYFSRQTAVSASNSLRGSFNTGLFSGNGRRITIRMAGIDVKYMYINPMGTSNSKFIDCSASNVFGDGAWRLNKCVEAELIRCEACRAFSGANGDGFNAHSDNTGDAFAHQTTAILTDCWSHDNSDDGISFHERSEFTVIGGLFEQNYHGGGITPANGSHCTCIGVYARENGEGGFLYMNPTSVAEGGVGGQIKCINCISESNNIWASQTSAGYKINSAGNKGILIGCKAIGEDKGYYVSDNDGALMLIDCGALNCTTVKGGKTANITVQNTTIVT